MKLENKSVLITGANRGIGFATVKALLSRGVRKVYAGVRNPDTAPDFGDDRVEVVRIDISKPDEIRAAAKEAKDIDVLINNAGTAAFGSLLDAPIEVIEADMNVNYYGTLNVIREFVPVLESRSGAAIVNLVTIGAFVNFPSLGGYSASKAALFSASQGIRMELAPRGISVHTVNPGPIDTDMAKDLTMDKTTPEQAAQNIVAGIEAGDADIFPDVTAEQMFGVWRQDYRALEQMVFDMHQAA